MAIKSTDGTSLTTGAAIAEPEVRPGRLLARRTELTLRADARTWVTLTYGAVAVGCVLRLIRWIDNPGVWLDEAFLAINLTDKPLSDLFGPLHFLQAAPPGFLLAEKGAEVMLSDAERWLRLFPVVASIASVVLFAYVALRLLAPPAAALAVALLATGEPLLLRSAEIKHYSTDVAITTLLLATYLWAIDAPSDRRFRRMVVLGLVGPAALWLSFPAVFVLAGVVVSLAVGSWETRSRRSLLLTASSTSLALASFALLYTVASSNARTRVSPSILASNHDGVGVERLSTFENAWWMFENPGGFDYETSSIAALLTLLGLFVLANRRSLDRLALLGCPLLLAGLADLLDLYPLGGRFSIFLVPVLILLSARGAQALVGWSRRPFVVGSLIAVFLAAPPIAIAAYHAVEVPARANVKPLLAHLVNEWREGDALYVYPDSQYQLRYYSTCEDCWAEGTFPWPTRIAPPGPPEDQYARALESVPPVLMIPSRDTPLAPLSDLDARVTNRVWLLFSTDSLTHEGLEDESLLIRTLESRGMLVEERRTEGARVYLVELER